MAFPNYIQAIIDKIEVSQDLSEAEEFLYLTKVMGYSEDNAKQIIFIVQNNNTINAQDEITLYD